MKFTIYVQDDCDFCKELLTPDAIEIEKVYINRDDFEGFRPGSVPTLQLKTMNLEGPYMINEFLRIVNDASEGKYNK